MSFAGILCDCATITSASDATRPFLAATHTPCHIIAKGKGASWRRFDLLNIFLGCFHDHRWWHDNPIESAAWFCQKWPHRGEYLNIQYGGGIKAKITDAEMEALIVEYKAKRKELQDD